MEYPAYSTILPELAIWNSWRAVFLRDEIVEEWKVQRSVAAGWKRRRRGVGRVVRRSDMVGGLLVGLLVCWWMDGGWMGLCK